jgi:hypothetical protein
MSFSKLALCSLAAALVGVGCGGDDDGGGGGDMCDTGETYLFVASVIDIGQADPTGDPNIVPGFNLDGITSDDTDPMGCFKTDFNSGPPDNIEGVDNQLGPILAALEGSFDVSGSIADAIADGSIALMMKVSNVDELANDSCVTVEILLGEVPGGGAPMLGGDGLLVPGQTFDIDSRSVGMATFEGAIVNGRVQGGPVAIPLAVPLDETTTLTLNIANAEVRFNIGDGTSVNTGVIGGGLDIEETLTAITMAVMDVPEMLARTLLENQADLAPDSTGQCRSVSMGLIFDGVSAVEGNTI